MSYSYYNSKLITQSPKLPPLSIAFIAPFGVQPKATVSARMIPLAHALSERGHQVRIVIPPWDDPSAREGIEVHPASNGGAVHVITLPLPKHLPNSLALTYDLARQALQPWRNLNPEIGVPPKPTKSKIRNPKSKIDIVHVFKPIGYSGLAALALQALHVPWVLDVDDWEGPGGWADVNPYAPAQKLAATLLEAMLPRMAGAVTAASRTLEARVWSFGLPRRRVFYLPNGVYQAKYASWTPSSSMSTP